MISFDQGNCGFNFRSVAVLIHDGHLLVHKDLRDEFWALPGGRVELFENSDRTVTREIAEELGILSRVVRPLWYVENFFDYAGRHYHEVATYYLIEPDSKVSLRSDTEFKGVENDPNMVFKWLPLAEIAACRLKPDFLRTKLRDIPSNVEFIRINERGG